MKMKNFAVAIAAIATVASLASCKKGKEEISIYVGAESVEFYQKAAKSFLKENSGFKYSIRVIAADTGTMGGSMIADNTACADIITIAHDNIGKLAQKFLIRPLVGEDLVAQIEDDNPQMYKDVIKSTVEVEGQTHEYIYGAPYITQALFLMYNKDYVSDEQAQTFEGLRQAALAARTSLGKSDVAGCTLAGTDGYNFSFTLLARKASDNSTTMKIYENLVKANCFAQGEDSVANLRWAQDAFSNGTLEWPNDSGYATMMSTKSALAVVTGSWYYNAIVSALGSESKVGIAKIPTYTLTSAHVEGTEMEAGTVMQGGSFVDCKVFAINAASARSKYSSEQQIIKYFTSKDMQNLSFKDAMNIPAYAGSAEYIESIKDDIPESNYKIAKVHTEMMNYGIPQPFVDATKNNYYYQMGAPDMYKNCIQDATPTVRECRETLFKMEYVWKWGNGTLDRLVIPEVLPADTPKVQ